MTILYVDFMDFIIGGGPLSSQEYVAKLDGSTKYWQLTSPLVAASNDDFKIKMRANRGNRTAGCFLLTSMDGDIYGINIYSTGDYSTGNGRLSIFGLGNSPSVEGLSSFTDLNIELKRESGDWTITVNGVSDTKTPTSEPAAITTSTETNLGRRVSGGFYADGYISELEYYINGVLINQIPLTNKDQGANQIALLGNTNAFMPNYSGDEWDAI